MGLRRQAWITLGVFLAAAWSQNGAPARSFPGTNGLIVFQTGDDDIEVIKEDGTERKARAGSQSKEAAPAWSADGTKIAFVRGFDLWVMNRDGTGKNRVVVGDGSTLGTPGSPVGSVAWSPDNVWLAYDRGTGNDARIFRVRVTGGTFRTQLTETPSSNPAWSPDGSKIAFRSANQIAVMDTEGSNETVLTPGDCCYDEPNWSPDGTKIAMRGTDLGSQVFVMNADGSQLIKLTTGESGGMEPSFSPDGQRIAYVHDGDIWVMNADGSNPINVTKTPATQIVEKNPDWGVFHSDGSGVDVPTDLISTGPTGGDSAAGATFLGSSADGSRVFFETSEQLVTDDTDTQTDVYERVGENTTLISTICCSPNFLSEAAGGERVLFEANGAQIYLRSGTTTTLIGKGTFLGVSADGSRIFFSTAEGLVPEDDDDHRDIYLASERAPGEWENVLVTLPPPVTGTEYPESSGAPSFHASSVEGSRVIYSTDQRVLPAKDTDQYGDLYESRLVEQEGNRTVVMTSLLSIGPAGGNGLGGPGFRGASLDASRVFFETREKLVDVDRDDKTDVYSRSGTKTTLISTGPTGGNGAEDARFDGLSADGSRVFFHTKERLVSGDTDFSSDVYLRLAQTTKHVGDGRFAGLTPDGSNLFFYSDERLVNADNDGRTDIYRRSLQRPAAINSSSPKLISTGPNGGNGPFRPKLVGAAAGLRALFLTTESLVAEDTDSYQDIYARSGSSTILVSVGPGGGNGVSDAEFGGSAADGRLVFFMTEERLVAEDTDDVADVFQRQMP